MARKTKTAAAAHGRKNGWHQSMDKGLMGGVIVSLVLLLLQLVKWGLAHGR
jgi:hypothetical protein